MATESHVKQRSSSHEIATAAPGASKAPHRATGPLYTFRIRQQGFVYLLDTQSHSARRIVMAMRETDRPPSEIKSLAPVAGDGRADGSIIENESLGIQIIEGFVAQGTRLTRTLPAGQTGNERPLEIVSEAWYSDELQTLLMSKSFDPRLGETTYKLIDIQRDEPSHSVFEVPGDYAIRDEPAAMDSRSAEKAKN